MLTWMGLSLPPKGHEGSEGSMINGVKKTKGSATIYVLHFSGILDNVT